MLRIFSSVLRQTLRGTRQADWERLMTPTRVTSAYRLRAMAWAQEAPRARLPWVRTHTSSRRSRAGRSAGLHPSAQALPSTPVKRASSTVVAGKAGSPPPRCPGLCAKPVAGPAGSRHGPSPGRPEQAYRDLRANKAGAAGFQRGRHNNGWGTCRAATAQGMRLRRAESYRGASEQHFH